VFVGNAFGKLTGSTQVQELGTIETPIVLTNTLSVGIAMDAVVGETNDGTLNDIRDSTSRAST
jgi:D-aminopeptidase